MNKNTYLKRINYIGTEQPNIKLLQQLVQAHLLHIPFENLDVHYGTRIEINRDKIFEKIVLNKRGGFCYELNGLFCELLNTLGFKTKKISARVYNDKTEKYGAEFDHLAIIVVIDGTEYLTDVGFGEFIFAPLKIELETIQQDKRGDYVLDKYDEDYFRVNKIVDGKKIPEYIFKNRDRTWLAFSEMCHYHQTSPDSHFTKKRLITRPTMNGRITITGNTLKIKNKKKMIETLLVNEMAFEKQLWNWFEIKI